MGAEENMSTITVTLLEEQLHQLEELASRFGLTSEELARVSIADLLRHSDESFRQVLDRVLRDNAELYQRLAS